MGPFDPTDVASYEDLYFAAHQVYEDCMMKDEAAGFTAVGASEANGVFVWAADGLENETLRGTIMNSTAFKPGTRLSLATGTNDLLRTFTC